MLCAVMAILCCTYWTWSVAKHSIQLPFLELLPFHLCYGFHFLPARQHQREDVSSHPNAHADGQVAKKSGRFSQLSLTVVQCIFLMVDQDFKGLVGEMKIKKAFSASVKYIPRFKATNPHSKSIRSNSLLCFTVLFHFFLFQLIIYYFSVDVLLYYICFIS